MCTDAYREALTQALPAAAPTSAPKPSQREATAAEVDSSDLLRGNLGDDRDERRAALVE
jgi:hypothetical protein